VLQQLGYIKGFENETKQKRPINKTNDRPVLINDSVNIARLADSTR